MWILYIIKVHTVLDEDLKKNSVYTCTPYTHKIWIRATEYSFFPLVNRKKNKMKWKLDIFFTFYPKMLITSIRINALCSCSEQKKRIWALSDVNQKKE